jgi:ribose/xylose/arabinose/galactoside ABC-type transport system permease subunit
MKTNAGVLARKALGDNLIVLLVILMVVVVSSTRAQFLKYANIYSLFYSLSIEFYAIIGMTLLLIMGEVDLSVGSTFALSGAFSGFLCLSGVPTLIAIVIALVACALIGFLNGALVYRFKVNSIVLTLGTMMFVRGIVTLFVQINGGADYPKIYKAISRIQWPAEFHVTIIVMVLLIVLLEILLQKHVFFRKMFFIGENAASARIYGINADMAKMVAFILSGFFAGFAGILTASRSGQTVFNTGIGLEFKMVTAALIAGSSLFGGRGSVARSVVALLFLAIVLNAMIMYGVDPEFQAVVVGSILILAIYADSRLNAQRI